VIGVIIPVRCFSCGGVIADKYEEYKRRVEIEGEDPKEVLNSLGVRRYCCRRMLLSQVDFIDEVIKFDEVGP
jgi:DNA-directed RNA polymerase subunit N